MKSMQLTTAIMVLGLLISVAMNPQLVYAPVPRVVLFLLAAVFPAILIASSAATRLELTAKGFLFASSGATALFLGLLVLLSHLARPELQVVAFQVVDEKGMKVPLSTSYGLSLAANSSGLVANHFIKDNSVVLIFPEQLQEQRITVRLLPEEPGYSTVITYARPPSGTLQIGRELR